MKVKDVDDLIIDYKAKLEAYKFQIKDLEQKIRDAEAFKEKLKGNLNYAKV